MAFELGALDAQRGSLLLERLLGLERALLGLERIRLVVELRRLGLALLLLGLELACRLLACFSCCTTSGSAFAGGSRATATISGPL